MDRLRLQAAASDAPLGVNDTLRRMKRNPWAEAAKAGLFAVIVALSLWALCACGGVPLR